MQPDDCRHRGAGVQILAERGPSLAHGAVEGGVQSRLDELLLSDSQLRTPLQEHGLAVPDLLESVLIAAIGDLERGFDAVEFGPGLNTLIDQLNRPFAVRFRLLQQGPRLSRQRRFLRIYSIVIALRRKSEPDSRLLQRGLSLLQPHFELGGFEDGDDLTFWRLTSH